MKYVVVLITGCACLLLVYFHHSTAPSTNDEQWLDASQVPQQNQCTNPTDVDTGRNCPQPTPAQPIDY